MKIIFTFLLLASLETFADTKIIISEFKSNSHIKSGDTFTIRIKPNSELVLPQVVAVYGDRENKKIIYGRSELSNGIDMHIPKYASGSSISEVILVIDEYYNGATQVFMGGVSMWATKLLIKVNTNSEDTNHIVNYETGEIG